MDYTELIQAVKKRESGAPERFQTAFGPLLRYIIAPILLDERDREECLSDVLIQVWESIGGYDRSRASFTTWLSALARNAALNRRRANQRRREGEPLDDAAALWLGVPLLAIAVLPFLFVRLPVNAETPVYGPSNSKSELRIRLLELGFPEAVLNRLDDGPLSRFEGAYGTTVDGAFGADLKDSVVDGGLPNFGIVEVPVRDDHYGFRTVYLAWFRWESPEERYTEGIRILPDLHGVTLRTVCPEGWLEWWEDGVFHTASLTFRFHSDSSRTGSYYADFSLPEGGDTLYGYVFWENISTLPEDITVYNYSITCAHRLSSWRYPYQLPSDILLSNRLDPGWRSKYWGFEGQLAPEGKYENMKYAAAGSP